ncbi:hypothetical protein [Streptomyces mirabilis]
MDRTVHAVIDCGVQDPEATFVHCRFKSGQGGECFRREGIVFECHRTMALPGASHGAMFGVSGLAHALRRRDNERSTRRPASPEPWRRGGVDQGGPGRGERFVDRLDHIVFR